ncbi:MAG TPA: class I SAM-dependent rRNA methyltransferase [Bryobacteraceae bacterium]|jgi:23S rRNA (cytosine1962-C5)-methyltransferase
MNPHELAAVRVNRKGASRFESGHPWIFSSDVVERGGAAPGSVVRVLDQKGSLLGLAHFSESSQITLRLLSRVAVPIDRGFYLERLREAEKLRRLVVRETNSYRLVHGEADLLPGLVIDRYGDYFVMQSLDQGIDAARDSIVSCLIELFEPKGILARNDSAVRKHESLPLETVVVHGEIPERVAIEMNGLHLEADLAHGQKTGVFLDQRENYVAAARFARGRALDCFTSTGGFALHMASKCDSVEAVDSSASALATASANAKSNSIENIQFREADVFDVLSNYSRLRSTFSTIVLDPPAFAKSRSAVDAALRGYKDINLRALRLLERGGVLVTCSCSHHVSEAALLEVLAEASLDAAKTLRILERRTQAMDHPILLTVPETLYLKCVIAQVV